MEFNLSEVWKAELEILDAIDGFCKRNNLRYSIAYGTMLGAVRHKGFIPWDDDIDIIMPRADYEVLLKAWDVKGFVLQNKYTNSDFTQNFTKIRKNNTTYIQYEWEKDKKYHKGFFVDIFPGDKVPTGRIQRKIQFVACAINLLCSRGFSSGSSGVVGLVEKAMLSLPYNMQKKLYVISEDIISYWNNHKGCGYVFPNTIEWAKKLYPVEIFSDMGYEVFCGKNYMCVGNPKLILSMDYGDDYMSLPPVEKRVLPHHPLVVSFDYNYEDLV